MEHGLVTWDSARGPGCTEQVEGLVRADQAKVSTGSLLDGAVALAEFDDLGLQALIALIEPGILSGLPRDQAGKTGNLSIAVVRDPEPDLARIMRISPRTSPLPPGALHR